MTPPGVFPEPPAWVPPLPSDLPPAMLRASSMWDRPRGGRRGTCEWTVGPGLTRLLKNTWEMRPRGSAGRAQKLAPVLGSGQEGPPDHPGQWRKP